MKLLVFSFLKYAFLAYPVFSQLACQEERADREDHIFFCGASQRGRKRLFRIKQQLGLDSPLKETAREGEQFFGVGALSVFDLKAREHDAIRKRHDLLKHGNFVFIVCGADNKMKFSKMEPVEIFNRAPDLCAVVRAVKHDKRIFLHDLEAALQAGLPYAANYVLFLNAQTSADCGGEHAVVLLIIFLTRSLVQYGFFFIAYFLKHAQ